MGEDLKQLARRRVLVKKEKGGARRKAGFCFPRWISMRWMSRCSLVASAALPLSPLHSPRPPPHSHALQHSLLYKRTNSKRKIQKQEDILGAVSRSLFPPPSASAHGGPGSDPGDGEGAGGASGAPYCVLVLDEVTTPIVSGATSVSEVLDYGVAREWAKKGLKREGGERELEAEFARSPFLSFFLAFLSLDLSRKKNKTSKPLYHSRRGPEAQEGAPAAPRRRLLHLPRRGERRTGRGRLRGLRRECRRCSEQQPPQRRQRRRRWRERRWQRQEEEALWRPLWQGQAR
mgnify:CR=1 FL=1